MLEEIMFVFLIIYVIVILFIYHRTDKKFKKFDKEYPVGSFFFTGIRKQKFLYGEWKYLGKDQMGMHIFERVK